MANIKNFGLSGVSADVQFGKAGGRVVYDAGNSVFKVTQADGSTLDNIRVATTPVNGNDAASKAYVDSLKAAADADNANVAADLATEIAATDSEISSLQGRMTAEETATAAATTDRANIRSEFAAADSTLDTNLKAYADQAESDAINAAATYTDGEITTLDTNLKAYADQAESDAINSAAAYTDTRETAITTAYELYADQAEADAKAYSDTKDAAQTTALQQYADQAEADAKSYTDTRESAITTAYQTYADQAESDAINSAASYTDTRETAIRTDFATGDSNTLTSAKDYTDAREVVIRSYIDTEIAKENTLAEDDDVALGVLADGDFLMYNATEAKWKNVDADTDMVDEGSSNLYWTVARGEAMFDAKLALANTGQLAEGTNLYWTEARGNANFATNLANSSTTDLDEGTNLYYTDARVDTYVSGGSLSALETVGNAVIGGDLSVGGVLTVSGTGTSTFVGDVSINGAITVAQDATFLANVSGDTMVMSGDLTVSGDTLLTQTTEVRSDVTLAAGDANVNVFHVTSSDGNELFEVRQNGDAIVGGTLTIDANGASIGGSLTTGDTTMGDLTADNAVFSGNVSINGNLTVDGDSTFTGTISGNDMSLAGNLIIGDADTDFVTFNADVNSHILPDASATYDLGSVTKKWNELHVGTVNATTLNGNLNGQVSDISNHEAYIEGLFSVVDNGGDGSLSYANGVFTFEGPSATEVRAHFTAGTGVHYAGGEFSIGQAVETTSDVQFNDVTVDGSLFSNDITASEVTINGNLTVTGTTTTVNTETIELADNIIVFNSNATGSATQDAGIEIERGDDANKTLLWDETNDRWTVGGETFVAATFIGDLTGDVTGEVSSIANHNTDALAEGSLNLYYTDARVAAYLTDNAYATEAYVDAKVADKDSFALRASMTGAGSIGTIVNVAGKTYYVSRIVVNVTSAFDAAVSISDGAATLMAASEIEEGTTGAYVAEMDFSTATAGGSTISLVTAATAGAATVTVEYVQM